MSTKTPLHVDVPPALLEAIRSFPLKHEVEHCGKKLSVSPFDLYATCPHCNARFKVRSFAAVSEVEDVFDAVFEWLTQPGVRELMHRRQAIIEADREE